MKSSTFKLIIPATIILFATCTKWWYVLPVDAPETILIGFPLPYVCNGWHTSLSFQFFILEFVLDFTIYLLSVIGIMYCYNRYVHTIKTTRFITISLWFASFIITIFFVFIISNKDNLFYSKRPFAFEVIKTGFHFGWQHKQHSDFVKNNVH